MNTPEISIIVPVYNVEQYLEECLESLANQTFANFEVICVDDGSTDASGLMLDRFAEHDARFKVFHKENAGVSSARNFALSKAVGDYIFFVDSDDYIEANTCEKLLELAHRDNSDIVVYGGDTFPKVGWIDNAFNTEDVVIRGSGAHALFHESGSYPLMCNKMYRRTLIADNGLTFNESLKLGEDNAFQFSVFPYAHTVTFTRDLFYHYRCAREGSAINELYEDRFSKIKKHLNVVEYVLGYWSDKGFLKDWKKELLLWSSVFLIDDLKHLPFRDRKEISSAYRDICEKTELLDAVSQLEESGQKVWRFVAGELALGDSPIATVLLVSSGASENNDNILSILDQSLQNIELFYIWSEEAPEPAKACFKGDSRVRFASTPNEALAQARGKYYFNYELFL